MNIKNISTIKIRQNPTGDRWYSKLAGHKFRLLGDIEDRRGNGLGKHVTLPKYRVIDNEGFINLVDNCDCDHGVSYSGVRVWLR